MASGRLSYLFFILLLAIGFSCSLFQREPLAAERKVARVGDHYLTWGDIEQQLGMKTKGADSAQLVNSFVENWIQRQVIIDKASDYIQVDEERLEKQIQDYRESLIIDLYQSGLVSSQLDTIISGTDVEKAYAEMKSNFLLNEPLIRCYYFKFPVNTDKAIIVKGLLRKSDEENKQKLAEIGAQATLDFSLSDSAWYSLQLFRMETKIPLAEKDIAYDNIILSYSDSNAVSVLKILEIRKQGNEAPISYVSEKLKKLILNRRKKELLSKTSHNLYQDAIENGLIDRYDTHTL